MMEILERTENATFRAERNGDSQRSPSAPSERAKGSRLIWRSYRDMPEAITSAGKERVHLSTFRDVTVPSDRSRFQTGG
jgi:hypothetical protein